MAIAMRQQRQMSLFDFVYPPSFKNPLKKSKTIPYSDSLYVPEFDIKVKKIGTTLIWIDKEGEYKVGFSSDVEAWKSYRYWCRSARHGGELI